MIIELGCHDRLADQIGSQGTQGHGDEKSDSTWTNRRVLGQGITKRRLVGGTFGGTHPLIVAYCSAAALRLVYRRSSRCLQATSSVAMGKALRRALGMGLPQLSQN